MPLPIKPSLRVFGSACGNVFGSESNAEAESNPETSATVAESTGVEARKLLSFANMILQKLYQLL